MQSKDDLQQRLLELVYDLLSDDEAAQLRRRIDSEPEVARAFSEAQRTADLLAKAARLQQPRIFLSLSEEDMSASSKQPNEKVFGADSSRPAASRQSPLARPIRWTVALAASLLLIVTAGGYAYHRAQLGDLATGHLRLVVTGPARLEEGVTNRYTVNTTSMAGKPLPVEVSYAVYTRDGNTLLKDQGRTDASGRLQVTVPADLKIGAAARLEVLAVHGGRLERMQTHLPVEQQHFVTQLSLDKPLYQPGETVYYRSLTLDRFGLNTPQEMPIHFEIHDPSGAVLAESEVEGVTQHGVGNGAFEIPDHLAGGEYTLVAKSLDEAFPEEKRPFFIRRYRLPRLKKELEFVRDSYAPGDVVVADFAANRAEGGAAAGAALRLTATVDGVVVFQESAQAASSGSYQVQFTLPESIETGDGQLAVVVDDGGTVETIAKTIPINLGKVEVEFFPEGGDLVAGLENRVYFVGRNPLGEPVHVEATVLDDDSREVAQLVTTHEGMGVFTFTPEADKTYKLKVTKPAEIQNAPALPKTNPQRQVVLSTGAGVFDAGASVATVLHARQAGLPLVVSAYCRGVQVGNEVLTTQEGANALQVSLADEAAGVIRLTVFDYSSSPPQPVAERLVYRRPDRRLNVRLADHSEQYSPGEPVQMSIVVTDEQGRPQPAVLGVAVVDDALLKMADDDTPQMPTHFYLTTEVENPADLEKADFYLSDDAEAPLALDLLLGTQGWRRFVEKTYHEMRQQGEEDEQLARLVALGGVATPPAMYDNFKQANRQYAAELAVYSQQRQRALGTLGQIGFFGGLALLLALALMAIVRMANKVRFWLPTLGAATACLILGGLWLGGDMIQNVQPSATPYQQYALVPEYRDADNVNLLLGALDEKTKLDVLQEGLAENFHRYALAMPAAAVLEDLAAANQWGARNGRLLFEAEADRPLDAFRALRQQFADQAKLELPAKLQEAAEAADLKGLGDLRRRLKGRGWNEEESLLPALSQLEARLEQFRFPVREYAHTHVAGEPGVRSDFAETLFWHPMLLADQEGRAHLKFELSDSVTTFRVLVDAHQSEAQRGRGRIGNGGGEIIARMPFSLEPKLPLEVNAGDRIDLPVAVNNDTRDVLPVTLALVVGDLLALDGPAERQLSLQAQQRLREVYALHVVGQRGRADVEVRGLAGRLADANRQSIEVVPPGFPVAQSYAGKIEGDQEVTVRLPKDWVAGSLEVTLSAFPSTLADLEQGVQSILQEPYGCFEQASTSNYPNVLSMQYMREHKLANPEITRRAKGLLESGYAKLTGYECPKKGYEWFGGDPGHEALTAYGLMEFRDMAQVYDVDKEMIDRTAEWLLSRRDGKGGFQRNPRALDSFGGAPQQITDAYVVWALSESDQQGIETEVKYVIGLGRKSDDPYLVALAAASAINGGHEAEGKNLLDKLAKAQSNDGHLDGKDGSITRSGGVSLAVETTALAALAWMKIPAYTQQANRALDWITGNRQGSGGFGSTQATILALKAMVEHARANRKTVTGGELVVMRNDETIGRQPFGPDHANAITIEGIEAQLEPGENELTIRLSGDNQMPYALDVSYRARTPISHADCPVRLTTRLAEPRVAAGDTVALEAKLVNTTAEGQPMTIAILGLPAGLQPRADQLEELKKAGIIDYYETRAREVICYWRSLAPEKQVELKLDLVAQWPGSYTGPASRTYLYYTAEQKQWVEPLAIEIGRD